jgi:HK97 family phage portal protein
MHRTVWDVAAYDVAFWGLLDVPELGRPVVVPLRPPRLEIKGTLWPTEFVYHGTRGDRSFSPERVVYFQGSHNLDDDLWGLPPIEALRRIIAEDTAAGEYREQFWNRGARFDGYISRPKDAGDWKDPVRERFKTDWRDAWSGRGRNAGGTPILEDGMEFHQTENADARSAQYVEARKLSREEAAALWHVDPIWVGIASAGLSFGSVVERHKALYQDTLGPWVVMIEQDLTYQALPAFEPDGPRLDRLYSKLNIAEKLRGDVADMAESISKLTGRPILTVNEGRALAERSAHPAGEGLAVPLNLTVLEDVDDLEAPAGPAVDEPPPAASRRGRKAGPSGPQHQALEAEHREAHRLALARTFNRQLAEVLSEYAADADTPPGLDEVWDAERWDAELGADLFGLSLDTAAGYGAAVAEALGFEDLDEDAWIPYLEESSRIAAENINAATADQVGAALDDEEDPTGAIRGVFALAAGARAEEIAQTRYTQVAGFTGQDVASQAGRGSKVWVVTSSKSRHPELDGETVPLGEAFSNGMAWPGDPIGGSDQTAGCRCMLVFE